MVVDSSIASRFEFRNPQAKHDRILKVGGERFYCRATYLSAWSQFFCCLFNSGFVEQNQKEIDLDHIGAEEFQLFMEMSHTARKIQDMDECRRLLELDRFLNSAGIQSLCARFILSQDDLDIKEKLSVADEFMLMPVVKRCILLIGKKSKVLKFKKRNPEFIETLNSNVQALFGEDEEAVVE